MFNQSILFEQPVNELVRVCLRLEYLLEQAQHGLRGVSIYDTRVAIRALMEILSLTERPDLRGKLTKEVLRQTANLQRYVNDEHIDQYKLSSTLAELNAISQTLQSGNGRFAQSLRDNEFLTSVRQHLSTAGGTCSFDIPAYYYWLQQPTKERHEGLVAWLTQFEDLFEVVHFILRLIRQSGQAQLQTAHGGFYQTSLDPQHPCHLIRVAVPNTIAAFPEISVGRHGVSIRFYYPSIKGRATLYEKDIAFKLSCCVL